MTGPWIAGFVTLAVLVAVLAVVVLGVLRRVAPVLERAEGITRDVAEVDPQDIIGGLRIGSSAPNFTVTDRHGHAWTTGAADHVGRVVYLLVEPDCAFCETLVEDLRGAVEPMPVPLLLVSLADDEGRKFVGGIDDPMITLLFQDGEASSAFRTTATPYAFVVENGVIVNRGHPNRLRSLLELIDKDEISATADGGSPPAHTTEEEFNDATQLGR